MRVLMLVHNRAYFGGGTFYRALHLGNELALQGMEVTLVASSPSKANHEAMPQNSVINLVTFAGILPPRWRYGYDPLEVQRRISWVRGTSWDIVHAFDSRPTVIHPALVAQKKGAKLILDWSDWFGRGGAVEERTNPMLRALLRPLESFYEEHYRLCADGATVINSFLEARLQALGFSPTRILPLKNGTYPEKFRSLSVDEARHKLGLPLDRPIIGYLGSIFAGDAVLLAEAIHQVQKIIPKATIVFIGNPKASIPALKNSIQAGFVPSNVLDEWLCACDVLTLPLRDTLANRGRWPSKLGDYFAAGRPVTACAVGDVGEILTQTGAGIATPPTAKGLANGLLQLLKDANLRARMGTAGRQAAAGPFHWKNLSTRVADFYKEIVHA